MFDNLYGYDKENDREHDYYSFRSHDDKDYQYCPYCNKNTEFTFNRCVECHNQ